MNKENFLVVSVVFLLSFSFLQTHNHIKNVNNTKQQYNQVIGMVLKVKIGSMLKTLEIPLDLNSLLQ